MFDRRKNADIFQNTRYTYQTNKILKSAIDDSISKQQLILEGDKIEYEAKKERTGNVIVSPKRTFEAAEEYAKQGKKVCVLNFASATNPGGGVINGSSAQEESLCRCSTLYPCLITDEMWHEFYLAHRKANNPLYNDDCIYTPAVKVFKSDSDFPELIPEKEWWDVDVITCAAPNLRERPSNMMNPNAGSSRAEITSENLRKLHQSRIKRIFDVAVANQEEVLILGAFGCGAFRNPPKLVAEVFAELTKEYRNYFDVIEYAIFCADYETDNFKAFRDTMKVFL